MRKTDRILALDIGASGIKMAEFHALKSGGIELVNFATGALGIDRQSDADRSAFVITTIRELMREKGIEPGPVQVSVAGQSVFSRFVKLPPVDRDKVGQIIQYEAQQNVPFPINEVVWDYQLIGGSEGELDVLLAAIKASMIEKLADSIQAAGLEPDLIDVAPMALYNAVRYNYGELSGCTLVVDIGARSTDVIFIEEGRIFSRSIPVAGNTITEQVMREFDMSFRDAEELKCQHAYVSFGGAYEAPPSEVADKVSKSVRSVMTRMHAEINRSINFYRSQQAGSKPELVLLSGGTSMIPYTDTFLKEKLKVDVDYLNPFRNVSVAASIPDEDIAESAHLLSETVGTGLRSVLSCPIEINLMPQSVLAEKEFMKKQPFFIMAGVFLVLTVVVWAGFFFKMNKLSDTRLNDVQKRVQVLEGLQKRLSMKEQQVNDVQARLDTLTGLVGEREIWGRILDEIHANLPKGMWITDFIPEEPKNNEQQAVVDPRSRRRTRTTEQEQEETPTGLQAIEISGLGYIDQVPSAAPIRDFRDRLRSSPFFSDKTEITWQPAPSTEDFAREFKIRIYLEEPIEL